MTLYLGGGVKKYDQKYKKALKKEKCIFGQKKAPAARAGHNKNLFKKDKLHFLEKKRLRHAQGTK